MKYVLVFLMSMSAQAKELCTQDRKEIQEEVKYEVNKGLPSHLVGAKITVTLADGSSSTVPAEKFMVVPRVQKTVLGVNKAVVVTESCKGSGNKHTVMLGGRKDIKGHTVETKTTPTGAQADVYADKGLVGDVGLYVRKLVGDVGAGASVDTNGTPRVFIGIDF